MIVHRLAAFTRDPTGGNPAGVVIANVHPSEEDMQQVAAEIGYSETAFVAPAGGGYRRYRVRYFSPLVEVPFCGHATIAAAVALAESAGTGRFELLTRAGLVPVDVSCDGSGQLLATLTSPRPSVDRVDDPLVGDVLAALNWSRSELDPSLPPARASAGAAHLILAARHRVRLADLDYDFERLRSVMIDAGLVTLQLVWREGALRYHARAPFPVGGVVEDPATGAAAAAFGAYLRDLGVITAPCTVTILQGADMGRPSTLLVELVPLQDSIRVSGHAVPMSESRSAEEGELRSGSDRDKERGVEAEVVTAGSPIDPVRMLAAYDEGVRAIDSASAAVVDWYASTPCEAWRCADLAGHVLCIARYYHRLLDAARTGRPLSGLPSGETLAQMNARDLADLPASAGPERIGEFVQIAAAYSDRLRDVDWEASVGDWAGIGALTIAQHSLLAVGEWHIHAWDFARAVGGDHRPADPELLLAGRRVLPGTPTDADPWSATLQWAGRGLNRTTEAVAT